jgi:hypothetical protein
MHGLLGTSIQQKDKEPSLNIMLPSYTGPGLELIDLPTCPKLWQLSRSQRNHQLIFMSNSVRPSECILLLIQKCQKICR